MDHNYAAAFAEPAAKLWKKGAPKRVNGLQLRIIPCLGSSQKNYLLMSAKQQFFVNNHTVRVENTHILNLDAKAGDMTLWRYLMSRAPRNEVLQRLFVSVDKSWKGGTHIIITVKPYAAEAMKAINYMIPECLHEYGTDAAAQWFTTSGLLAYQNVKWDPTKRSTTSQQDRETNALVEEALFGIGTTWKLDAPVMQGQPQRPATGNLLSTPLQPVQIAIHSRSHDDDIRSFGSIFGRTPDDTSIATTPEGLSTTEKDTLNTTNVVVQFDSDLPSMADTPMTHDDRSFDASSAGFTTGSTRSKLREQEKINDTLQQQMLQLNEQNQQNDDDSNQTKKTTQSTRNQLAVALATLKLLQEQQTTTALLPASGLPPGNTHGTPQEPLLILGAVPAPTSGTAPTIPPIPGISAKTTTTTVEAIPGTGQLIHPNPKAPAPALPPDIKTGDVGRQI
jgi:hypothetical protein